LDEFYPEWDYHEVLLDVTKKINERLPRQFIVDGQALGPKQLMVDEHDVQSMLCKVYQIRQWIFSCCVGDHGRDPAKVRRLLESLAGAHGSA